MLLWTTAMGYGAAGGLTAEAVIMWGRLYAWQQARHKAIEDKKPAPRIAEFVDLFPDLAVAVTRALLGCAAGWLLHDQVNGVYAAFVVGASAPALLASLGKATSSVAAVEAQSGGHAQPAHGHRPTGEARVPE